MALRRTSKTFNQIIDSFFVVNKELKVNPSSPLSPEIFQNICQASTNLRSLVIQSQDWLTDDLLTPVLKNNPKLEILDITDCVNCSSTTLQVKGSPSLTWSLLTLFPQVLTVNCPNISWLILRGCTWVDTTALDYFSNHRNSRKKADDIEVELDVCSNILNFSL